MTDPRHLGLEAQPDQESKRLRSNGEMSIRRADPSDVELLVQLMAEFYSESGYDLDQDRAASAFGDLLSDPSLGRVWILGESVGYVVLTLGYSMEYGGRDAFVDDLFVRKAHRRAGLGSAVSETVLDECREQGVKAIHLVVGRDNVAAQALYRKFRFADNDRQLLTCRLGSRLWNPPR